ncbi:MAG: hypothetical protein P8Q24_01535 [Glaciecola sp.]|nr:hypothetical protein [Glaciecola sp.]MDG1922678.1 hypothetical protein [Glaciecola sp.]
MLASQSILGSLDSATSLGLVFAGILFLLGLLTGIWKFQQMMGSKDGLAHRYVDIAHRAALTYSFACILLAVFSLVSQLDETIEFYAMLALVVYFTIAVVSYIGEGIKQKTDNVIAAKSPLISVFMVSLIIAEVGGFIVLFYGMLDALF